MLVGNLAGSQLRRRILQTQTSLRMHDKFESETLQEDWADRASSPGGIPADEAVWWGAGEEDGGDEADAETDGRPAGRRASRRAAAAARCAVCQQ